MKNILRLILPLLAAVLLFPACTRNEGPSSDWFGQWKLVEMTIDGADNPDYHGNIFWSFQSGVIFIVEVESELSAPYRYGNWSEEGNRLILDFNNSDNGSPDTDYQYVPQPVLLFSHTEPNILTVEKFSHSEILLRFDRDGSVIRYRLKRWG